MLRIARAFVAVDPMKERGPHDFQKHQAEVKMSVLYPP